MKTFRRVGGLVAVLAAVVLLPAACRQPRPETPAPPALADTGYVRAAPTAGGTGRFYMGREIARVMGHQGADWLERAEREAAELPVRVVQALALAPDAAVADIGAGTGYFTFRLAARVPQGRVYAVDIQPEMLARIRARLEALELTNVTPVLGTATNPNLPAASVDVALLVDAYHEFSHPREMLAALFEVLRPGGRLVLVEYRGEDPTIPIRPLHRMTEAQVRREVEAAGFAWLETKDFLPQQHLVVFQRP